MDIQVIPPWWIFLSRSPSFLFISYILIKCYGFSKINKKENICYRAMVSLFKLNKSSFPNPPPFSLSFSPIAFFDILTSIFLPEPAPIFIWFCAIKMELENMYGLKYDCLVFDLDDTLYPLSSGLSKATLNNIQGYMAEQLDIEKFKIPAYCDLLYKNYGTTMAGLRAIGYDFDYDEYHSFVHGRLPYENLKPDLVLRSILLSLPIRKVIFTNADKIHAEKSLSKLGLEDCFERIICFETLNTVKKTKISKDNIFDIIGHFAKPNSIEELPKTPVVCKPSEDAIEHALMLANIDPTKALFFDDSVRNIQAGKRVALGTVLVGHSQKVKGADYVLESIHNIKEALPELWKSERKAEVAYPTKIAVETSVIA